MSPTRFRLDLEYDGTDFVGWQLQRGVRTVQGVLEEVLESLVGHPVQASAAGRTDAGVHARQQVVTFDTSAPRTPAQLVGGLNARLPPDVGCVAAAVAPEGFDPRHSPHVKEYRYRWLIRPARSPLRRGRVWHVGRELDVVAMNAGAELLRGTHDFSSFRAAGCTSKHPIRTLEHAEVVASGDEVHLVMHGTGFLRHMVRITAGTLHEVGRGRRPAAWVGEVLAGRNRNGAGRTAPAHGLCLEWIAYR